MFPLVDYAHMNAKQKENYNFQKIAALLADHGFNCLRLTDDYKGADFLAVHIDGQETLKVQLKTRFCLAQKYVAQDLWVAFQDGECAYLYNHDDMLARARELTNITQTHSWNVDGHYSWPSVVKSLRPELAKCRIGRGRLGEAVALSP